MARFDHILIVTNDLTTDRRMQRTARTLTESGKKVLLIGRNLDTSIPLKKDTYSKFRLTCRFRRGPLFYAEFVIRVIIHLRRIQFDTITSVDLDTILIAYYFRIFQSKTAYFDAHEWFTEVPELEGRFLVKKIWSMVGHLAVSRMNTCYTVNYSLAGKLKEIYKRNFAVVHNFPERHPKNSVLHVETPFTLFYLGVLNMGRGLETLFEALADLNEVRLCIAGEGDLSIDLRKLCLNSGLSEKVEFIGRIQPAEISVYASKAHVGVNLLSPRSLSYYYSSANKIYDYLNAGLPVITMNFPEYRMIHEKYNCAVLLNTLNTSEVKMAIEKLRDSSSYYDGLSAGAKKASQFLNWENEKAHLLKLYNT